MNRFQAPEARRIIADLGLPKGSRGYGRKKRSRLPSFPDDLLEQLHRFVDRSTIWEDTPVRPAGTTASPIRRRGTFFEALCCQAPVSSDTALAAAE